MEKIFVKYEQIESIHCPTEFQETTIEFLRNENVMHIFTSDNTSLTKFKKLIQKNPDEWVCWEGSRDENGFITGYFLEGPKKYLTLRVKTKEISDENKEAARKRLKEMWNAQKQKSEMSQD